MKKISFLALMLVAVLPGCCGKRKAESYQSSRNDTARSNTVAQYAQMANDNDIEMANAGSDEFGLGDLDPADWTDEDWEALLNEDMGEDMEEPVEEEEEMELVMPEDEYSDETQVFNWVDAQADDEFQKIYFAFNSYNVKPTQDKVLLHNIEQVKQLLADVDSTGNPTIVIEGHACQEGSRDYNLPLSEKRAFEVAKLFKDAGIDESMITVVGRGQECPAVKDGKVVNGSRQDRWPNRRVEVRVIYT